jgi:hypothetical protein
VSNDERIAKIAATIGVTVDELLASESEHYTYTPGMCFTCEAVYVDVHHERASRCDGCGTMTVHAWPHIIHGTTSEIEAVTCKAFRPEPILRSVS